MQLYTTNVVPSSEDLLWELPEDVPAMAEAKLLIISAPYEVNSPEEQTLIKMMTACRLVPPAYAVMQLRPAQRISWQVLAGTGAPKNILLLGVAPDQLAIYALFRPNHCNSFLGCTFIPGYTLAQMEQNAALKRELWEQGLKSCFNL